MADSFLDFFTRPFGAAPPEPPLLPNPLPFATSLLDLASAFPGLGSGPKVDLSVFNAPASGAKLTSGAAWDAPTGKLKPPPTPQTPGQAPASAPPAAATGAVPTGLPAEVTPLLQEAASAAGVDPALLAGVWRQESGFQHYSGPGQVKTSPAGARGLGQLMPATAAALGVNPDDPRQNALGSARYLRQMLDAFGGDEAQALAAYNAGPGNIQAGIYPTETQRYVPLVQGYATEYRNQPWAGGQPPAQGAVPVATTRQAAIGRGLSQFNVGLDPATAEAACGPIAAVWFAQHYGRAPTVAEAMDLAKQFGWNQERGAAGPQSIVHVLERMGVQASLMAPDPPSVAREIRAGRPVIVDTPGHYYQLVDYNPETQQFQFGDAVGRGRWARLDQLGQFGYGDARTAIAVRQ